MVCMDMWYQSSHLTIRTLENKNISQNVELFLLLENQPHKLHNEQMTGQKDLTTRINATIETDIKRTGGPDGNRTI